MVKTDDISRDVDWNLHTPGYLSSSVFFTAEDRQDCQVASVDATYRTKKPVELHEVIQTDAP